MNDVDLTKLDPILLAVRDMTFDGRPALEAMKDDPVVFEAVRRMVHDEVAKLLDDPADDETALQGNQKILEIIDNVLAMWGPNSKDFP